MGPGSSIHQNKEPTPSTMEPPTGSAHYKRTLSKLDELYLQPVIELVLSVVVLGASGDLGEDLDKGCWCSRGRGSAVTHRTEPSVKGCKVFCPGCLDFNSVELNLQLTVSCAGVSPQC